MNEYRGCSMKKILCAVIAVGAVTVVGQARAAENWTTRLPGVTEGLASGAVPPAGLYFVNETFMSPTRSYGPDSKSTSVHVDAAVDVPILEWAPGIKLLGEGVRAGGIMGAVQPDFCSGRRQSD